MTEEAPAGRPRRELPVIRDAKAENTTVPVFARVGIVGLGLIGGSIALAARAAWPSALVIGVDRKEVLERAMTRHAVDVAADDLVVLAEADLVILAAPIQQNLHVLSRLADHVSGSAVVTDTGSTKRAIAAAAAPLPSRLSFVGGHPLGGAARGGIEHARADLFVGRPWLFTPGAETQTAVLERLEAFAVGLGASPKTLTPDEHDRLLALISHLPQLTVSALMHVVGEAAGVEGLSLSGRGLQDTTRLASSPSDIWREVCATNADDIAAAIDALLDVLQRMRAGLEEGDTIEEVFASANRWREALTKTEQG